MPVHYRVWDFIYCKIVRVFFIFALFFHLNSF
jgi:hypothetical protein